MPTPNFELLKDAHAIIDGMPAENVNLNSWRRTDRGATCGTIACAGGWLTLHPQFKALGLLYARSAENVIFKNPVDGNITHTGWSALAQVFSLTKEDAERLFGGAWLEPLPTHRSVFLRRIRDFLEEHGQLNWQLQDAAFAARDLALDRKDARRARRAR